MPQYLLANHQPNTLGLTLQPIILAITAFILLRMTTRSLLKRLFHGVPVKLTPKQLAFDDHYYYHVGIVLLVLPGIQWNTFDVCLWLFSYIVPGMLRGVLLEITQMQQLLLNTLNIDKNITSILRNSRTIGVILLMLSTTYIILCMGFFHKATVPISLHLLYPTWRLLIDSFYICLRSSKIIQHLPYFTNNNATGYSPIVNIDFIRALIVTAIRVIHFAKLINTFLVQPYTLMSLIQSPWILILLWNLFTNSKQILTQTVDYYNLKWLQHTVNINLPIATSTEKDNCSICQEQLVTCRKIDNCGHRFHYKCIFKWMTSRPNAECPICRSHILQHRNQSNCCITKQYY